MIDVTIFATVHPISLKINESQSMPRPLTWLVVSTCRRCTDILVLSFS